jgi:hypothetical protein
MIRQAPALRHKFLGSMARELAPIATLTATIHPANNEPAIAQARDRWHSLVVKRLRVDIAGLSNGGFVVSWTDFSIQGDDTSGAGIKAQIFGPRSIATLTATIHPANNEPAIAQARDRWHSLVVKWWRKNWR